MKYIRMVHCCGVEGSMHACHAVGPGSIPGRDKCPGWGFSRGFSSPVKCQEVLGSQGPRMSFGRRNHPLIFASLKWMGAWMVCIVLRVCVVSEVAPALSWSLIRGGLPCPSVVKKVCVRSIVSFTPPTGRGSVRPGRHGSRKSTYLGEVKLR